MSDYRDDQQFFDVRNVNLLTMNKVVDLEILIAECDTRLANIKGQIEDRYDDKVWEQSARRAIAQIEDKRRLAVMKRDAVVEAKAVEALKAPSDPFKARFIRAAEIILAADIYQQILAAASRQGGPA